MTIGEKIIAEKPCTTCGAKVGEKCRDEHGNVIGFLHIARSQDARPRAKRKK